MRMLKVHWNTILLTAALALSSCSETEIIQTSGEGEPTDPARRELQLTLQNKLTLNQKGVQTRAGIATNDEQRIDALDVYVFGATEPDGDYTYQEKFSYRSDGSAVAGATTMEVTNGDGTSAKPSVLLRPKKGLYIKMFCVANQPELSVLDNVTDPAAPVYKPYTTFTPLVQTNPGGVGNTVTMGVPTEADFCKLLSRVIDPVNKADSIVPALPMVGSCTAPIDLHSFDLASRLYSGIRLVRTVARFDVVNDATISRFTLQSVAMGNGRPVTQLYPVQALKTTDGKLITYPERSLIKMPEVNKNKQLPAFYAYASPVEDEGYLILKGTYQMNATETQEVSYNVPFNQVIDGTGSRVAINPNHRYTIAITKADLYHVDFDFTVADWENGEDLGSFTPDNAFGSITVQPAGQFNAATRTMKTAFTPGATFTVEVGNNATPEVSLSYDEGGNEWLEAVVTIAPLTRTQWAQNTTVTVKTKTGSFTKYPPATLKLTNTIDGTYSEMRIYPDGVQVSEVTPADNTHNTYDAATKTLTLYAVDAAKATAKVFCPNGLAALSGLPSWLTETHTADGNYTFALAKVGFPSNLETTDATYSVTFVDATDALVKSALNIVLKSAAIHKAACTVTDYSGVSGNSYTSTSGSEQINMKGTYASATTFRFKVPSAKGTTLSTTDYGWFTVSKTTTWSEANPYDIYTLTSKTSQSSYSDKSLTFTNNVSGGGDFTVKASIAGIFLGAVTSLSASNNASYSSNTLFFKGVSKENVATVKVFAPATVTVSGQPSWLTVSGSLSAGYTFYFSGSPADYTITPAVITFTCGSQTATVKVELTAAAAMANVSGCSDSDKTLLRQLTWAPSNLRDTGSNNLVLDDSSTGYGYYYTWNSIYTGNGNFGGGDPCTKLASKYGSGWRTPTQTEFECLTRCTDKTLTSNGGVKGMIFYNGTIAGLFLPAAGCRETGSYIEAGKDAGTKGYYWTSNQVDGSTAAGMDFSNGNAYYHIYYKSWGMTVRCVK